MNNKEKIKNVLSIMYTFLFFIACSPFEKSLINGRNILKIIIIVCVVFFTRKFYSIEDKQKALDIYTIVITGILILSIIVLKSEFVGIILVPYIFLWIKDITIKKAVMQILCISLICNIIKIFVRENNNLSVILYSIIVNIITTLIIIFIYVSIRKTNILEIDKN